MIEGAAARSGTVGAARFAASKFRATTLPVTHVPRERLHRRLDAGRAARLTLVVGSAGAGKSVLLSSWVTTRPPGMTCWLACDRTDATPPRFWTAFIASCRALAPGFGADAADLLAMDGTMSADVIESIADDAALLPPGSVIVVDDFHTVAAQVGPDMTTLVERWPSGAAQLVLAGRSDPGLRLHRMRLSGELCELRDRDLNLWPAESGELLAKFGVDVADDDLAQIHERSEGWVAAVQMVALSLRGTDPPARAARVRALRSSEIAEYFVSEVLDQQPPQVAEFMLETSVFDEMDARACTALTQRDDAARLLHAVELANLFLIALDDDRTTFRYHHLVHQVLRAELRARGPAREEKLQLRAGEWFERNGDARRAAHHYLAARQADRALALVQDSVVPDFLHDPVPPPPLDLDPVTVAGLSAAPERALAVATDLLLGGDVARGCEYLDLLSHARPAIPPGSRLAARYEAMRAFGYGVTGELERAVAAAAAARAVQGRAWRADDWNIAVGLVLLRVHNCLHDPAAVEREAAGVLSLPTVPESARHVLVPGARALAWFDSGDLARAADSASAAESQARRLGFDRHFFAVDHLRVLAGLALERRDLDTAERLTERALAAAERRRPVFEFLTLIDRARVWGARGQTRDALAGIEVARRVLPAASPALTTAADELEALLCLELGDTRSASRLAERLPAPRRALLAARIALAADDHDTAQGHLQSATLTRLTPRDTLVRQLLLAAAAIAGHEPAADAVVSAALLTARQEGFVHTVVTTAPQVAGYLVQHSERARLDPFFERLVVAALEVRSARPEPERSRASIPEQLTAAELRVIRLLPTSTYLQIAATLYVSRNTVKSQLRSVYQKLGVSSRAEAIQRAVDLRLL